MAWKLKILLTLTLYSSVVRNSDNPIISITWNLKFLLTLKLYSRHKFWQLPFNFNNMNIKDFVNAYL